MNQKFRFSPRLPLRSSLSIFRPLFRCPSQGRATWRGRRLRGPSVCPLTPSTRVGVTRGSYTHMTFSLVIGWDPCFSQHCFFFRIKNQHTAILHFLFFFIMHKISRIYSIVIILIEIVAEILLIFFITLHYLQLGNNNFFV